jgi:hypothetical protein
MKATLLTLLALTLLAAPASAQKAYIDYDSSVDFNALKTFAWRDAGQPSLKDSDPLMHKYIVDAIVGQLETAGLQQVEDNADCYVTYHASASTEYSVDTTYYGYGGGWRWGGFYGGPSTSTVRTYEQGTLIIDAWNGGTKEIIWRGSATATWPDDPAKARKTVDKMIAKIVKKWDKEYHNSK